MPTMKNRIEPATGSNPARALVDTLGNAINPATAGRTFVDPATTMGLQAVEKRRKEDEQKKGNKR